MIPQKDYTLKVNLDNGQTKVSIPNKINDISCFGYVLRRLIEQSIVIGLFMGFRPEEFIEVVEGELEKHSGKEKQKSALKIIK